MTMGFARLGLKTLNQPAQRCSVADTVLGYDAFHVHASDSRTAHAMQCLL